MPKYFYVCTDCDAEIDVYHGMNENYTHCDQCGQNNCLEKKPSSFSFVDKPATKESKTGQVVKKSIEDFQEDLDEQKKQLKNNFYEPN